MQLAKFYQQVHWTWPSFSQILAWLWAACSRKGHLQHSKRRVLQKFFRGKPLDHDSSCSLCSQLTAPSSRPEHGHATSGEEIEPLNKECVCVTKKPHPKDILTSRQIESLHSPSLMPLATALGAITNPCTTRLLSKCYEIPIDPKYPTLQSNRNKIYRIAKKIPKKFWHLSK